MLIKSAAVHGAWAATERTLDFKVTIKGTEYTATDITSLTFDSGALNGDALSLGSTYTNTVKITFSHLIEGLAQLDEVTPEIGILLPDGTWDFTALGVFIIDSDVTQDRNNNTTTISTSDRMCMMGGTYTSELTYPTALTNVAVEIADKAGMTVNETNFARLPDIEIASFGDNVTYRDAIGYVAQFAGGFATFDRDGLLDIRTLATPGFAITPGEYQSKGLTKNEAMYRIGGLQATVTTAETDDAGNETQNTVTLQAGSSSGTQITITNPAMTQAYLDDLYDQLQDLNFYPFTLNWFGNPALEIGDWITLSDTAGNEFEAPNLSYALTFNGSLAAISKADTTVTSSASFVYEGTLGNAVHNLRKYMNASGQVISEGIDQPSNPKPGDVWFKKEGSETSIMTYVVDSETGAGSWVEQTSTKHTTEVQQKVDDVVAQIQTVTGTAQNAVDQAQQAIDASGIAQDVAAAAQQAAADAQTIAGTAANDATAAKTSATQAATDAKNALTQADGVSKSLVTVNQDIDKVNGVIKTLATSETVDAIKGDVSKTSAEVKTLSDGMKQTYTKNEVTGLLTPYATQTWAQNQITAEADKWGVKLQSVQGQVDGIQVGGTNLLQNSNLKNGTAHWRAVGDDTMKAVIYTVNPNTVAFHDVIGNNWMRFTAANATQFKGFNQTFSLAKVAQKGDPITVSMDTVTGMRTLGLHIGLHYLDIDGKTLNQQWIDIPADKIGHMYATRPKLTFNVSESNVYGINLMIYAIAGGSGDDFARNIKAELGNIATDWSPAPEDATVYTDMKSSELSNAIDKYVQQLTSTTETAGNALTKAASVEADVNGYKQTVAQVQSNIDGLSVGGRNILLGTATPAHVVGNGSSNNTFNIYAVAGGALSKQNLVAGTKIAYSFDWKVDASVKAGTFVMQFNQSPWSSSTGGSKRTISATNQSGHISATYTVPDANLSTSTSTQMGIRLDGVTGGITISNFIYAVGSVAKGWSPAPEDAATVVAMNQIKTDAEKTTQTITALDKRQTTTETSIKGLQSAVSDPTTGLVAKQTLLAGQYTSLIGGISNPNLITHSIYPATVPTDWINTTALKVSSHTFYQGGKKKLYVIENAATGGKEKTVSTNWFPVKRDSDITISLKAFAGSNSIHQDVYIMLKAADSKAASGFDKAEAILCEHRFNPSAVETWTKTYRVGAYDMAYIRFDNNGSSDGKNSVFYFAEPKVELGSLATPDVYDATQSQFTQLQDDMNLRVTKGDLISEINLQAGSTLIKSNKIYLDAASVVMGGSAFINSANIKSIDASKITTGELASAIVNAIQLNASQITAGVISGTNLSINLGTGEISFSKGSITSMNGALDINVDNGSLSQTNWNTGGRITFDDGGLQVGYVTEWGVMDPTVLDQSKVTIETYGSIYPMIDAETSGFNDDGSGSLTMNGIAIEGNGGLMLSARTHTDLGVDGERDDGGSSSINMNSSGMIISTYSGSIHGHEGEETPYTLELTSSYNGTSNLYGKNINIGPAPLTAGGTTTITGQTTNLTAVGDTYIKGNVHATIDGQIPTIRLYSDKTSGIVSSYTVYDRTYSSSSNVYITQYGTLGRTTSATKYKTDIQRDDNDYGERLLNLSTATWVDKAYQAKYAADPGMYSAPQRNFGMIAEDLANAGLEMLVERTDTGEIEGIQYDRIAPALIPVIRKLRDKIEDLENEIKTLEGEAA